MDSELIAYLREVIIEAGHIALELRDRGLDVSKKDDNSLVSNADLAVSDYIYQRITELELNFPIICEEQDVRDVGGNEFFWLIDPIDGTRSFVKGKDSFTVNIALIRNKKPIIGLILQPSTRKLYYTDQNNNLVVEDNGLQLVLDKPSRKKLIAIVSSNSFNSKTQEYLDKHGITEVIAIPSSIKFCLIADSTGDVFPKFGNTMEWDIAAGHAIINAAGGQVLDLEGEEITYDKPNFSNPYFIVSK